MNKEKFFAKVKIGDKNECWLWLGRIMPNGYGQLNRHDYAHRVSYEIHNGQIPRGKCVCHSCDNPSCVNPNHLFVGTQSDNMLDMANKGRSTRGSVNAMSKLTEKDILEMWAMYDNGIKQAEIAEKYNCHPRYVSLIFRGHRWKHIFNK